jgi:hypothetical protein
MTAYNNNNSNNNGNNNGGAEYLRTMATIAAAELNGKLNVYGVRPFADGETINASETADNSDILRAVVTCINALISGAKIKRDNCRSDAIYCYLQAQIDCLRYCRWNARIDGGKTCGARIVYGAECWNGRANISDIIDNINGAYCALLLCDGEQMSVDILRAIRNEYERVCDFSDSSRANWDNERKMIVYTVDSADICGGEWYGGNVAALCDVDGIKDEQLRETIKTARERGDLKQSDVDILLNVANGTTTATIAALLDCSKGTISKHFKRATYYLRCICGDRATETETETETRRCVVPSADYSRIVYDTVRGALSE